MTKREFCSKGHKLSEVGVYRGYLCRECQKAASRATHHAKMAIKRAAGLAPGSGRWRKDGKCRQGLHLIAEVGTYTNSWSGHTHCKACATDVMAKGRAKHGDVWNANRRLRAQAESIEVRRARYNEDRNRNKLLKKTYGITVERYKEMFAEQDGRCAVCRQPETMLMRGILRNLCVDHNHTTKANRGLLCHHCNRAVGLLRENPMVALGMMQYLLKWANIPLLSCSQTGVEKSQ